MDISEFKKEKIEGRKQLLEKIVTAFKTQKPVAIHQFGSGTTGYNDEFSDIDIWITFKDSDIANILKNLSKIFGMIAPVILRHHSKSWSPVGGSSNSIIHETNQGLFVVDYYISKLSETVINKDSTVLFGDDAIIKRGLWRLNKEVNKNIHDSHTLKKDISLLLDLIFISTKLIARKNQNEDFLKTFKLVHKNFRKKYNRIIKSRQIKLNFNSNRRLLSDLYKISNKSQKRAIYKIRKYLKQIEVLYS